jgi:hypothetical protein
MWQILERRKPMSTPNTDLDKDQEASRGAPGTIYTEDTLQLEKASPQVNVPQPPKKPTRDRRKLWFAIAAVVIVLALVFSVLAVFIAQPGKSPSTQVTPTTTAGSDTTPTPSQGVTQEPQNGPSSVNTLAYWDTILGTQGTNGKVESVSFANVMGNSNSQALVTVRHSDANSTLDVYVFNNITSKSPVQIFKLDGLIKGEAKISYYNSIMTGEVDLNSRPNAGNTVSQMQLDLYREFAWTNGSMTQVAFPGIYPDLTRYQAELAQAKVNGGHDTWKLDAVKTTQHWNLIGGTAKLVTGGGPNDLTAVVNVTYPDPGQSRTDIPITQVTLQRLEGNLNGIWEITSVGSNWLFIYTPKSGSTINSPVTVTGFGPQFEAQVGTVYILDHLYKQIQVGNNFAMVSDGSSPPSKFSLDVKYTSSLTGNAQEGIVELVHTGGASFDRGVVLVKVLIGG